MRDKTCHRHILFNAKTLLGTTRFRYSLKVCGILKYSPGLAHFAFGKLPLLAHPSLRLRYRASHLFATKYATGIFCLTQKPSRVLRPSSQMSKKITDILLDIRYFGDREGARTLDLQRDRLAF